MSNKVLELKAKNNTIRSLIIFSIPAIILLASIFHSLLDFFNRSIILAIFLPVNESIFEHLKLCIYPTILIWVICYIVSYKNIHINISKWVISMITSIVVNILTVTSLYYIGSSGFNIHSTVYDISTLVIGTILGQLLALHIYEKIKCNNNKVIYAYIILIMLILSMCFFTFNPPKLPIFKDNVSKTYGFYEIT